MINLKYAINSFKSLMVCIFPKGIEWGGNQHCDLVRIFFCGVACFTNYKANDELSNFMKTIMKKDWKPDESLNWPTVEQN